MGSVCDLFWGCGERVGEVDAGCGCGAGLRGGGGGVVEVLHLVGGQVETGTFGGWRHGGFGVGEFFVGVFPVVEIFFFFFEGFFGRTVGCWFGFCGGVKVLETIVFDGWRVRRRRETRVHSLC